MKTITSLNPATGQPLKSYPLLESAPLDQALERSYRAYEIWRTTSFSERRERFRAASALLTKNANSYAVLMAEEMGKPVTQGLGEIKKCVWVFDYYAEHGEKFLQPENIATDANRSYVAFQPLGVILAVMPWNFPFWQAARAAAPALTAGNAMVLKHASNVPGCAAALESIFREAGFPQDLFQNLFLETRLVARVIESPRIQAVTLTGSTPAGKAVASKAGEMLKKTVLELGGSDPYIILEDADVEEAAKACAYSRMINTGQSCIAAKRFIAVKKIKRDFESALTACLEKEKMGNPLEEDVTVGPMARPDLRDELHRQVTESIQKGARLLLGGVLPHGPGAFYPPTVLSDVRKGMPVFDEETFGPVAAIIEAADEREALALANDTPFGLGGALFTKDVPRGEALARDHLVCGSAFVNTYVRSDPRLPFGGIKESGYGRELGLAGIREFVNMKTVYIQ